MSRDPNYLRRSAPAPRTKRSNSVSSANQSSGDDSYRAVDEISDDDEDEPDVEKVEERHILDDDATPRPSNDDELSWQGFDDGYFREQYESTTQDSANWDNTSIHGNMTKSVRFCLDDDSSDSDMQSIDSNYPDILERDSLSAQFLQRIEHDEDNIDSEGSWEIAEEETLSPATAAEQEDSNNDTDGESSLADDSDSDSGNETTEEQLPPDYKIAISQVMKRPEPTEADDSSADEEVVRRPPRRKLKYPKMGRFSHSMSKPFAVLSSDGKKLIHFNTKSLQQYGSVDKLANSSLVDLDDLTPRQMIPDSSPYMSNSASIMMSAFQEDFSDNAFPGQLSGPMEAFYSWPTDVQQGNPFGDSSSFDGEDLDEGEEQLDIDNFLNFGDESSDEEQENDEELESSRNATNDQFSTPGRPTTRSGDLLDHFEKYHVASFRQDQRRRQLVDQGRQSKDSLAFGGPLLEGAVQGLKLHRLPHANTPITPARKRKVIPESSPASPLSRIGTSKKRSHEGDEFNSRKRRSTMV